MSEDNSSSVLIVDDQQNWRDVLKNLLKQEGLAVHTASSFDEARKLLGTYKFSIVILDVRLEDQDIYNIQGIELLKTIKSQNPEARVVILTGYPESIREGVLERYSADALLLKVPSGSKFDIKGFKDKIHELLHKET